jgi:hypothetical protein
MIFYVFLEPEVISYSNERGPDALQNLTGILRGFVENCFITEFEDYRLQNLFAEQIKALPDCYERKVIKTIFSILQKRNRFIYCFIPDYNGAKSDLEIVLEKAGEVLLDLIFVKQCEDVGEIPDGVEIADITNYHNTSFADKRSKMMAEGVAAGDGEFDEEDFLNRHYLKIFRYARRIEICDKLFGRRFGDNFEYTTRKFLQWFEKIVHDPNDFILSIHCEKPDGHIDDRIKRSLQRLKRGRLSGVTIELVFYESPDAARALHHDRYILTDQIALQVGRGMDFLNRSTQKNRDTNMNLKSEDKIGRILATYAGFQTVKITI